MTTPQLPPHLNPRRVTHTYQPPPAHGAGRRRLARVLSWLALTMAVVILLAAGGLWVAFNHYNGQIHRIDVGALGGGKQNFLLVGSDSRDGSNGEGTQGTGASFVTGQRSDTVILVHLFGSSQKAELVSFPRDAYVEVPAFTNPKTHVTHAAHHTKLNAAFAEGGPPLLIATIEHLTNIKIDHFLQIDFSGFKGMVNKLGGVDVCLTKPARDHWTGINLTAGHHHINGDVALAFVRQRHGLANGDIDRIARQQQFIGSLVHKVLSADTLSAPWKLNGFLDVATSSLQADKQLSGNDIKNLALRLRNFNSGGVSFATVPIAQMNARRGGADVVLLDEVKDAELFTSLRNDQAPGSPPKTGGSHPATVTVAPGNVRVSVFNGSGINGLGRKAAADITTVGFQTVGIPQTRGSGASQTVILYGPTKSDSAHTLQAAVPGSILQEDPSLGRTLQLVVGTGYHGAQHVVVTPAKATPSKTTTTTTPVQTAQDNPCTT